MSRNAFSNLDMQQNHNLGQCLECAKYFGLVDAQQKITTDSFTFTSNRDVQTAAGVVDM